MRLHGQYIHSVVADPSWVVQYLLIAKALTHDLQLFASQTPGVLLYI